MRAIRGVLGFVLFQTHFCVCDARSELARVREVEREEERKALEERRHVLGRRALTRTAASDVKPVAFHHALI